MSENFETNSKFDLDILNCLAKYHKEMMNEIGEKLNNFKTNKDIYEFINNFYHQNNLSKAFPIGISINHIIAHDSYNESNLKTLRKGDLIKIDFGLIECGNIIDSARTFCYGLDNDDLVQSIVDSEIIVGKIENFIRKQIETEGKILIQKISAFANATIVSCGYNNYLDLLGGHTIEYGKVHGSHYILNKPLKLLPKEASYFIDPEATIGEVELFAIEIYIGEKNINGKMIKNNILECTHFQLNEKKELDSIKLNKEEKDVIEKIFIETQGLVYELEINKKFDKRIIKNLIDKNAIIKYEPLEFVSNTKEKIKYVQYEDCFIIKDKKLINLTSSSYTLK
jgi:methionine aminopeptidase